MNSYVFYPNKEALSAAIGDYSKGWASIFHDEYVETPSVIESH